MQSRHCLSWEFLGAGMITAWKVATIVLSLALGTMIGPRLMAQNQNVVVEQAPLSAYGELPGIEDAVLSPSGNRIAAVITVKGGRALVMIENGTQLIRSISVSDLKVRSFEWIGEDQVLLITSTTERLGYRFTTDKHEFYLGTVIPTNPNIEPRLIFSNRRNLVDAIFGEYGIRQIDGRWYGFFGAVELQRAGTGGYTFRHGRPFLYRVDFSDLTTKEVDHSAEENADKDWLVDAKGNIAATFNMHQESGRWKLRNQANKIIAQGSTETGRGGLIGLGKDGQTAIYFVRDEEGFTQWFEVPLAGGEAKPFLKGMDIDRLFFANETGHMLGYLRGGANPEPVFDNERHMDAVKKVRAAFKDMNMRMLDWTDDLNKVIVRTSGNKDSGTWFTVDVENLKASAFAYERNAILPKHVGDISTFKYTAADGLDLDGILTLPPGREPKQLPLILLPHGGPHSYDSEGFDWWAQAFASRGYAVFQPNFRGSTHRTGTFRKAGYGQWGRKMQTDKSDAIAALAEAGIADPDRTCIAGASYGGYAALAGVTLQQGFYRCAVAVAPVSDIRRMYREDYRASARARTTKKSLLEQLGPQSSWDDVSPQKHADQSSAPILLIHGKDDTVVPYVHSTKMADALKDADKPFELVTLEGEDHWLSRSETRRTMLEAAVRFVEQHNPPD